VFYHDYQSLPLTIESIMNVFFSQPAESVEQHIVFSLVCAAAWEKTLALVTRQIGSALAFCVPKMSVKI